jgi:hypothetical protein
LQIWPPSGQDLAPRGRRRRLASDGSAGLQRAAACRGDRRGLAEEAGAGLQRRLAWACRGQRHGLERTAAPARWSRGGRRGGAEEAHRIGSRRCSGMAGSGPGSRAPPVGCQSGEGEAGVLVRVCPFGCQYIPCLSWTAG